MVLRVFLIFFVTLLSYNANSETIFLKNLDNGYCKINNFNIDNADIPKEKLLTTFLSEDFDSECINSIEYRDLDKDGYGEMIIESSSIGAGTGIAVSNKYFVDYDNAKVEFFEIRSRYNETNLAHYLFPILESKEIAESYKTEGHQMYFIEENTEFIFKDNFIDIFINKKITFSKPELNEQFKKLNNKFKNGNCKYFYGKIDINKKLKLLNLSEKETCSVF